MHTNHLKSHPGTPQTFLSSSIFLYEMEKHFSCSTQEFSFPFVGLSSDGQTAGVGTGVVGALVGAGVVGAGVIGAGVVGAGVVGAGVVGAGVVGAGVGMGVVGAGVAGAGVVGLGVVGTGVVGAGVVGADVDPPVFGQPGVGNIHVQESRFLPRQVSNWNRLVP